MSMWSATKPVVSPAEIAGQQRFVAWPGVDGTQDGEPALLHLLNLLASHAGQDWRAYDAVPAVGWRDPGPVENLDVGDPQARFARFGTLLLAGFGLVELPDAGSGVDAGVRIGNEGEAGITLSGSAEAVEEIELVKFYVSDPAILLRQQWAGRQREGQVIVSCDAGCHFQVRLPGGGILLAQAWVEEEGEIFGPGSTTFVFRRPGAGGGGQQRCREV